MAGELTVIVGVGNVPTVTVFVAKQPLASITLTVYTPGVRPVAV
jgi:hypothetical protein